MPILEHILELLQRAAIYNRHDAARPQVVLWTDGERHWEKVVSTIAAARPGFFIWKEPGDDGVSGPSTWIRYQLGKWKGREVPVVYLPGIARSQFRGIAGFPPEARHLFSLQYLGHFCSQTNGKDWTPFAFLSSEDGGLGLDLAKDRSTLQALHDQLTAVLSSPVESLRGRRLDASDFHDLAVTDSVGIVLQWMSDPESAKKQWPEERTKALAAIGKKEFGMDFAKDGILIASEKLTKAEGKWGQVWSRFAEAPTAWRGVAKALESVEPHDLFEQTNIRIPATNQKMEDELRAGLLALADVPAPAAREKLAALAAAHADRARSVWASLSEAPLALASVHLGLMVEGIAKGLPGNSPAELAHSYLADGWQVDAEARRAWACATRAADSAAVTSAIRAAYLPWVEESSARLQSMDYPLKDPSSARTFTPEPGTVLLFVDGFRADLAKELSRYLTGENHVVEEAPSWTPLPTVTATSKPGWMPIAQALTGSGHSTDFQPVVASSGKPCNAVEFRKLLPEHGWTWLPSTEAGDPSGSAWTEIGAFDSLGHSQGAKLAMHIDPEMAGVVDRLEALFRGGWKKVVLLTDHGWLWMPGGLPKAELPKHLAPSKWGRCALPESTASHGFPQTAWFWATEKPVVLAPGIHAFFHGMDYTHGGLTMQEALTLTLTITPFAPHMTEKITIKSARWVGLRLQVQLSSAPSDVRFDIRSKAADPSSSLIGDSQKGKYVAKDAKITLLIEDDSLVGQAAILVVTRGGTVLAKKNITIGED